MLCSLESSVLQTSHLCGHPGSIGTLWSFHSQRRPPTRPSLGIGCGALFIFPPPWEFLSYLNIRKSWKSDSRSFSPYALAPRKLRAESQPFPTESDLVLTVLPAHLIPCPHPIWHLSSLIKEWWWQGPGRLEAEDGTRQARFEMPRASPEGRSAPNHQLRAGFDKIFNHPHSSPVWESRPELRVQAGGRIHLYQTRWEGEPCALEKIATL